MKIDLNIIQSIARQAGEIILQIYQNKPLSDQFQPKSDNSPLTLADKASHEIIAKNLYLAYPDIPILSEEGKHVAYSERKKWERFWLVDPLDGTKEFLKRNGEFTVNIALIENGYPVAGIIYAPILREMYCGDIRNINAVKIHDDGQSWQINVRKASKNLVAVGSRSHATPEDELLLSNYDVTKTISIGSSLKFCMVATGIADIYYRHGPTYEWDTAAGQAIVEAAGGRVLDVATNERFGYNKEDLRNPSFLVLGF